MYYLEFENVSLDDLPPRVDGLVLKAFLGFSELEYLQPVQVRVKRRYRRLRPGARARCIYLLAYAHGVFKVGSSTYEFIVPRMFSQGALAGTVLASVLLPGNADPLSASRELEESLSETLNKYTSRFVTRRDRGLLEAHVRELAREGLSKHLDLVSKLKLIAERGWSYSLDLSRKLGAEVISAPALFTFTSKFTESDKEVLARALSTSAVEFGFSKVRSRGVYELVILNNAICVLKEMSTRRIHIGACDRLSLSFELEPLW